MRAGSARIALDLCREFRAIELERFEFTVHSLVERRSGLGACLRERLRRGPIGGISLHRGGFQRLELFFAGIDQRDITVILLRQRRKLIDWNVVFATGGAQAEQPFLNAFKLGRIEIRRTQCRFEDDRGSRRAPTERHRAP